MHAAPYEPGMSAMRHPICRLQVQDYPAKKRDKWMFDWPSQIILVGVVAWAGWLRA